MSKDKKTGRLFLEEGLICEDDLTQALAVQEQDGSGGRLFGVVLCGLGLVTPLENYAVLSRHGKFLSLEEGLVQRHILSGPELGRLSRKAAGAGEPLLSYLLDNGHVPKSVMIRLLEDLFYMPLRSVSDVVFGDTGRKALTRIIGSTTAETRGCVPLQIEGPVLTIGMTDPSCLSFLSDLDRRFPRYRFSPVFISRSNFSWFYRMLYQRDPSDLPCAVPCRAPSVQKSPRGAGGSTRIITVASGKGGVGKTSISLNLSLALAGQGFRVCLFDADLGLANVNILTGLYPDAGLAEVIQGRMTLSEIMIRNYNGIDIIPGSSGVEKLADLSRQEASRLVEGFEELASYDYFILDTSAGISAQVLAFCRASREMLLVATPEPTSLTDAYSLLKVLSREEPLPEIRVIINQVRTAAAAKKAYAKLKTTAARFLSISLTPLGIVARDEKVSVAVAAQVPFLQLFSGAQASRCIHSIARKLSKDSTGHASVETFWDQCLGLLGAGREDGEASDKRVPVREDEHREALNARLDDLDQKVSLILEEVRQIKAMLGDPGQEINSRPRDRFAGN